MVKTQKSKEIRCGLLTVFVELWYADFVGRSFDRPFFFEGCDDADLQTMYIVQEFGQKSWYNHAANKMIWGDEKWDFCLHLWLWHGFWSANLLTNLQNRSSGIRMACSFRWKRKATGAAVWYASDSGTWSISEWKNYRKFDRIALDWVAIRIAARGRFNRDSLLWFFLLFVNSGDIIIFEWRSNLFLLKL